MLHCNNAIIHHISSLLIDVLTALNLTQICKINPIKGWLPMCVCVDAPPHRLKCLFIVYQYWGSCLSKRCIDFVKRQEQKKIKKKKNVDINVRQPDITFYDFSI